MANTLTTKRSPITTAMIIISVTLFTAKVTGGLDLPWLFVLAPFIVGIVIEVASNMKPKTAD